MGSSFRKIRKCPPAQKKRNKKSIISSPPKKHGQKKILEPADSERKPVVISKGIGSPVHYLTKLIDAIINDYPDFQKHWNHKKANALKSKLRKSPGKSKNFKKIQSATLGSYNCVIITHIFIAWSVCPNTFFF